MKKIAQLIQLKSYYPAIIFSFSRRECEANAMGMRDLNFNSPEEAEAVEEIFTNALACLSEEDRFNILQSNDHKKKEI